ncbi:helix-turn-helix domain-containing protein [Leuconostoc mesenteroides]|uniref:helix-turn-helix domain-containing protein n=1 Tax=Leuconostoc mesenteroides TaxID=1245 RepID=UPI001CBF10E3|nr:helix-turn-helix domain-containing protein [Leuconostoc mesenteroides]MBZ1528828.1 helix-turn-helix domain-containing protein [Leuconostoc mesenteroides]MCT3050182.1 helix-turn-helix domain-containing protein [Leuconostoc mesenteroides]
MNRISELRKETNTSQTELAKLLGVTRQAISLYEKWPDKGGREPKIDTWEKLANFFGVSVPYIQGLNYPRTDEEFFEKLDNHTNQMLNHYNNSEKDEIYKNWNIYFASLYETSKAENKVDDVNKLITGLSLITNEVVLGLPIIQGRSGSEEGLKLIEKTIEVLKEKKHVVFGPNGIEYFSDDKWEERKNNQNKKASDD